MAVATRPTSSLEVVVPAYNEAVRLPDGLDALGARLAALPVDASVLVVDNGSTDGTARIAAAWRGPVPVRVITCPERGKGAAVRAGLLATTARYVGFCDADMATDLAGLDDALALLGDGHPVVVGSRRHPSSLVEDYSHPLRKVGAIVFNRLTRDLAGGVTDTQCGFKFFDGPLARAAAADLTTSGFAFDVELLMHCARRGAAITAIPVRWRDVPGSTFSVRRHSARCLRDVVVIRLAARRPVEAPDPAAQPVPIPLTEISGAGPG
ncbi:glycosyltransferase [Actinomadura rupiterrae]|uniref:glycosyltransferase n=1 Tax=Actinomadura rupiterrae TaxID=559627 RepID=UPI0020A5CD62|nr:glycosyltransferase [Actinomadura rupiterrae]MCP2335143.1 glycosyltransferase involved in cell wall biosynthesis [Actinomadura rupiterrae]